MTPAEIDLQTRRECAQPDPPIRKRGASSFDVLAERIRQVAAARKAGNVSACRAELRALANEAGLLAAMAPLRL